MPDDSVSLAQRLTPPGVGGIHVFGLTGPGAEDLARCHFVGRGEPGSRLRFGRLVDGDETIDDVLLAKTQLGFELSCHGGRTTESRVIDLLETLHFQILKPTEDASPLANRGLGGEDLVAVEAHQGIRESWSTHAVLFFLAALEGSLGREIRSIRDSLVSGAVGATERSVERLGTLLSRAPFGTSLFTPPRLVLTGEPNVGKSSLFNHLLGEGRAIVTGVPGTTRDLIESRVTIGGYPFVLTDSAGVRESEDPVEEMGVLRTYKAVEAADLVVEVRSAAEACLEDPPDTEQALVVLNKCDLADEDLTAEILSRRSSWTLVSALTGHGMDTLRRRILNRSAFRGPGVREFPCPFTSRQVKGIGAALEDLPEDPESAVGRLGELLV